MIISRGLKLAWKYLKSLEVSKHWTVVLVLLSIFWSFNGALDRLIGIRASQWYTTAFAFSL